MGRLRVDDITRRPIRFKRQNHALMRCMIALVGIVVAGLLMVQQSSGQAGEGALTWESLLNRAGKLQGRMRWMKPDSGTLEPYLEFVLYGEEENIRATAQLVGGQCHKVEDQQLWLRVLSKLTLIGGEPYLDNVFYGEGSRVVCYGVDKGVGLMFFDEHWRIHASLELPEGEPCLVFYDGDEKVGATLKLSRGDPYLVFPYKDEKVRAKVEMVEGAREFVFSDQEKAFRAVLSLAGKDSYFDFYEKDGKTRLLLPRLRLLALHELAFFSKDGNLVFSAP